jgi:hypothetical protein
MTLVIRITSPQSQAWARKLIPCATPADLLAERTRQLDHLAATLGAVGFTWSTEITDDSTPDQMAA